VALQPKVAFEASLGFNFMWSYRATTITLLLTSRRFCPFTGASGKVAEIAANGYFLYQVSANIVSKPALLYIGGKKSGLGAQPSYIDDRSS
jgi:hypothetical protein